MKILKLKKVILSMTMILVMIMANTQSVFATSNNGGNEEKPPQYDVTINIIPASGWHKNNSRVNVLVQDNKNTGTFRVSKIEAKVGNNGAWEDITTKKYIEVSEKCTVYVQVTDAYGTVYTQSRYISGYDTTPPSFNCAIKDGVLTVEAYDTESGIAEIYINGYKFTRLKDGKLTIRLQKFDASYTNFTIKVVDNSGNESESYTIENPYYNDGTDKDDKSNPAESLPDSSAATNKGDSVGNITSITDETGKDISKEVNKKQFYLVTTKEGQTFYIIIDTSNVGQVIDDGEVSNGTVYFLTNISNNDLLNITTDEEQTLPINSVATGNAIDYNSVSEEIETTDNSKNKTKKTKEKKSDGTLWIILIVIGVGAVVVIVKMKNGKGGKMQSDEELYGENNIQYDDYEEDVED